VAADSSVDLRAYGQVLAMNGLSNERCTAVATYGRTFAISWRD